MTAAVSLEECLDAVACPGCGGKVLLTRERVLFCPSCLMGYPLSGDVPDFRAEQAIDFKKLSAGSKESSPARLDIPSGKAVRARVDLARGRCVVFGRAARQDPDSDITYAGLKEDGVITLPDAVRRTLEGFLTKQSGTSPHPLPSPALPIAQAIGGFRRDPDVFIDDRSVSKAHALFYHDGEGLWVVDLVSKNGTYVNGAEVERIRLKTGDVVSLGSIGVRVLGI